jgi:ankyrin repeat protein
VKTAAAIFAANAALANDPGALANAAWNGHQAFVRLMLSYVPDLVKSLPSDEFWTAGAKTREMIEFLFERGLDANRSDWLGITPLHHFAKNGDIEKAEIYIKHGAGLDARDEDIRSTPLAWAAKYGKAEMVAFLLKRGAKPNLPDDSPWATPLAWAKRRGHQEVVKLLVDSQMNR